MERCWSLFSSWSIAQGSPCVSSRSVLLCLLHSLLFCLLLWAHFFASPPFHTALTIQSKNENSKKENSISTCSVLSALLSLRQPLPPPPHPTNTTNRSPASGTVVKTLEQDADECYQSVLLPINERMMGPLPQSEIITSRPMVCVCVYVV